MTERAASHYQRLGVTPSSSTQEIRTAYRALASRLHPDHTVGSSPAERSVAERRMREINESWRVLQDPKRRRAYDASMQTGSSRPQTAQSPTARTQTANDTTDGMADVLDGDADDDMVDVFPSMSGMTLGLYRLIPWVALTVAFVFIFVMSAYAGGGNDTPAPSEPATEVGDCIDVQTGTDTTVVPCTGAHEFEVVAAVDRLADCPPGSEGRRLAADGHFDCLVPGP